MKASNLDRYRSDLARLTKAGDELVFALLKQCEGTKFKAKLIKSLGEKDGAERYDAFPDFGAAYQSWYSEALAVIKQLIPDRLADFRQLYERPRTPRKEFTVANYVIEDAIQGMKVSRGETVYCEPSSAIPKLQIQIAILKACAARFESSLFDIRQLVQADLMDDELAAARELLRNKFFRAAGVVAGVVLEKHLQAVAAAHSLTVKARASLGDYIAALKDAGVLETPEWRKLQHLSELRAKCTHNKGAEPIADEVEDLISGANRTIKNLF